MLRRALMLAQGLCLLPGLYVAMIFSGNAPSDFRLMMLASTFSVALQGAGIALLSLRRRAGWWLVLLGTLMGALQPSFGPTPLLQTLLNVLPSVLGAVLPLTGWILWMLYDSRSEPRDLVVPIVAALAVLSFTLIAWSFARTLPFQGTDAMRRDFLIWLAARAVSSVGLILVAIRRSEGWWVLLASALLLFMGRGANMMPMFNVAFPILAALNLIQWRLGEKTSRHGLTAKPVGT